MTFDINAAVARASAFVKEGRIIQRRWHDHDKLGREVACLLGSLISP